MQRLLRRRLPRGEKAPRFDEKETRESARDALSLPATASSPGARLIGRARLDRSRMNVAARRGRTYLPRRYLHSLGTIYRQFHLASSLSSSTTARGRAALSPSLPALLSSLYVVSCTRTVTDSGCSVPPAFEKTLCAFL